ncbi:hypothetical protein ACU6U9_11490 [Pseudomonas sp. HK3]
MSNSKTTAAAAKPVKILKNTKKGLKIDSQFHVNLEHVCAFIFYEKSIQLQLSDQNIVDIYIQNHDQLLVAPHSSVSVNEFKRIERELKEYMNI